MHSHILTIDLAPAPEELRVVQDGLRAFTDAHAGPVNARPFAIFARRDTGKVLGGLTGELRWTWLFVGELWLPESLRRHGLGTALLTHAEDFAQDHNCSRAYLDTLEFRALPFYQRLGYSIYGVQDGFPPGSCRFYLQKSFG